MSERKQLELNLDAKRPRARLLEDTRPPVEGSFVTMSDRGMEMFIGYSPWVSSDDALPPCSGDWDLKMDDVAIPQEPQRCTFNADNKTWTTKDWPFPRVLVGFHWRGLKEPWEKYADTTKPGSQKRTRAVLIGD